MRVALFVAGIFSSCTEVGSTNTSAAPVGVLLEASEGFPALELAISTRPVGLEDGLVQPIASAIHTGLRTCQARGIPVGSSAELRAPLALTFGAQHGKLTISDLERRAPDSVTACLSAQLSGAGLTAHPDLENLTVRLRATHPMSYQSPKAGSPARAH